MDIQKHVTSIELSKQLKSLGVPQKSHMWWVATYSHPMGYKCSDCKKFGDSPHPCAWHITFHEDPEDHYDVAAFLASELGEMLPPYSSFKKYETEWMSESSSSKGNWTKFGDTEPNSRAQFLIHLIERKVVDVKNL